MTKVFGLPQNDRRYDEASQWIAKLDKSLSREDTRALQAWIAEDPANEAVLLEMAVLWDKMDSLKRLSSLFPEPVKRQPSLASYALAGFTTIILVFAGLWLSGASDAWRDTAVGSEFVYQTHIGEQSTVTLQDGTQLVLNTNSLVKVNYSRDSRLLRLQRGEIYVKVAQDKARPLSVLAGEQVLQAVGTEFNVEINNKQQIELVVLEGKVKVGVRQPSQKRGEITTPTLLSQTSKTLGAGEALLLGSPGEEVTTVSPEEIEVKLSWQQGNLVFAGESLEEAIREVERYTPVEFVFMNKDLKKIRVAGLFRAGDVEGLLSTLRENFDIVYQYTDEQKVELSTR